MTHTPTIWCPDWCKTTAEEHQAQVEAGETELVHQSDYMAERPVDAVLSTLRTIDGTPVLKDPDHEPVMFLDGDELVPPSEFVDYANDVLAWVEKARRTGPHPWLTCPSWCDTRDDHNASNFAYDTRDGRPGDAHVGYAAGGDRFLTTVVYDAETGAEWYRFVALELPNDDNNTFEEFEQSAFDSFAEQAALAAKWSRREVEIP